METAQQARERGLQHAGPEGAYLTVKEMSFELFCQIVTCVFHQCNLHIHGEHSRNNRMVPMVTLSDSTAIGLVIAHGNS